MTTDQQAIIDAIALILKHGCYQIACEDCPIDKTRTIQRDLCISIQTIGV